MEKNGKEKKLIKVSVVVPVYNAEKYLNRCIDSILKQSLKEIEIILVDDGSTDESLEILRNYERLDNRVKVLTQQNKFAGVARNNGLSVAHGEYIIFWDSDDYFDEKALDALYCEAKKCDADICVGDAVKIDSATGEIFKKVHYVHPKQAPGFKPFSYKDIPRNIFNFSNNSPWNKLYRKEFVEKNGLQFQECKRVNDMFFVMAAFVVAEKITFTEAITVYYQFKNSASLSVKTSNNYEYIIGAYEKVKILLIEKNLWTDDDLRFSFQNKLFSSISSQLAYTDDYSNFINLIEFYKKNLERFGMDDLRKEDFFFKPHYDEYRALMQESADRCVFDFYLLYRNLNVEKSNKLVDTRKLLSDERKIVKKQNKILDRRPIKAYMKLRGIKGNNQ